VYNHVRDPDWVMVMVTEIGNVNSIGTDSYGYDEYNDYDRDHNDIHNDINQQHYYMIYFVKWQTLSLDGGWH